MMLTSQAVRHHRLRAHHLLERLPAGALEEAAGACGMQNSPPGAWETAMFNRVTDCSREQLEEALYQNKTLLQAWSCRGAPVVFPTKERNVFLAPLAARNGEEPWIYTKGVGLALDYLGMTFDQLLPMVEKAAGYLDENTVVSKEELDRVLAQQAEPLLPREKLPLWRAPSMYGSPDRQTVGGAVVSFLLRPCAFRSLVVFGRRENDSPQFTSCRAWLGHPLAQPTEEEERELVRKFLRCYGPAVPRELGDWLGCTPAQAKRLWAGVEEELEPVTLERKKCWMLSADPVEDGDEGRRLMLLGPHDPYLDLRDRSLILEAPRLQRLVWKTVGNPGAVLEGGVIKGFWRSAVKKGKLELKLTLWQQPDRAMAQRLAELGEEWACFRRLMLTKCQIETLP